MSESVEKTLTSILNEETWTRAAISNYSIANFQELDDIIAQAKNTGKLDEVRSICREKLEHSKNSIIALYLSSIISLMDQELDDSNLVTLIGIFTENKRMQIVEYLCKRTLEFSESKLALRHLADYYSKSENDQLYTILERLTKIDYDDAESPKKIAMRAEETGDIEKAVEFYKKSIYRFILLRKLSSVKEIWAKLTSLIPEDIDFFYRVQDKVSVGLGESRNTFLMYDLYKYYAEQEKWDIAINILKLMLHYDADDSKVRAELVSIYKKKYASHSHLDECIRVSNLDQNWRSVFEAIAEFEKHIAFDTGSFVFHKTWGVGRINSLENEVLKVDFARQRGHEMSLKMALSSLQTLSADHIWVLKATKKKDELTSRVKSDPEWALKTIITSFDNNCDIKKIKQELVPSLLTAGEWTNWNTKAKKILEENPNFGINPNDVDSYTVRERPISIEEKLFNQFKQKKNFFSRYEIINTFIEKADVNDEVFHEMVNYFDGFLKAPSQVSEQVVVSQMLITSIGTKMPHLVSSKPISFVSLYEHIENPQEIYESLKDKDLKHTFLKNIKNLIPHWQEQYILLFPSVLSEDIVNALLESGDEQRLQSFVRECFENPKVYRESVIWFFKNSIQSDWFKNANIDYEKQLIALIHILDLSLREIENKQNTTDNRRIVKQVIGLLFENEALLEKFIDTSDKDTVNRIYLLIADIKDLDSALKAKLRSQIQKRFPDFNFQDSEEKENVALGLIVTARMLDEKKKELQNILEVRIPQNQRDLGHAISLGDLRENSEYKAAREEQAKLSNLSTRLQNDIERAEVFDPLTANTKKVGFGTKVTIDNLTDGSGKEVYTILGPWESQPEKGIISYLSPLGRELLNKKVGEMVEVKIMEQNKQYKVIKIEIATIE